MVVVVRCELLLMVELFVVVCEFVDEAIGVSEQSSGDLGYI